MKLSYAIAAAALTVFVSSPVSATPMATDGTWQEFSFGGDGSSWGGEPFTFTLTSSAWLTVTDAQNDGDQFSVFDNLVSLGETSVPTFTSAFIGNDWDAGVADVRYSTGMWLLGPGAHSITGLMFASPYGSGTGALRVQDVPIPAAGLMLLTGLAGLAGLRRRKTA